MGEVSVLDQRCKGFFELIDLGMDRLLWVRSLLDNLLVHITSSVL